MGETPLFVAAAAGNLEVATVLLGAGAEVNSARSDGRTPSWAAIQHYSEKEEDPGERARLISRLLNEADYPSLV